MKGFKPLHDRVLVRHIEAHICVNLRTFASQSRHRSNQRIMPAHVA